MEAVNGIHEKNDPTIFPAPCKIKFIIITRYLIITKLPVPVALDLRRLHN